MNKFACQYAIVRFLPYRETGEFANVGIVMLCPEVGYFDFKLLARGRRITEFFKPMDAGVYSTVAKHFKLELLRIRNMLVHQPVQMNVEFARNLFGELTRQRETMLRFDDVRVVLADDPALKLDELFGHYVQKTFATRELDEKLLERNVRKILVDAKLGEQYRDETLGDADTYHVHMPFVHKEEGHAMKAIKPLHLAHDDPTKIYEHGWAWLGKVEKLRALMLLPEQVMFLVRGPAEAEVRHFEMYQEIIQKMAANDVLVIPEQETQKLLEFARV
jgi:hypothetical protein